jgi:YidC/Oxa1 family membrane protein insertase
MTPVFDGVQGCLEAVHDATGLPWYLTIVLSTLAVRGAFLPLIAHQLKAGGRYATAAKPEADKLWRLYAEARDRSAKANDALGLARATALYWGGLRAVLAKHDCRPLSLFGGSLVQLPVFLTFVVSMRHMIRDGGLRADLAHGGALWFEDLTLPDETLALPLVAIGLTYANLEMSLGKAPPGTVFHWLKDTGQVLLIAAMPLTTALPQGVFLYWVTNAAFSAVQTRAVRADGVRAALGLPAVPVAGGGGGGGGGGGMPVPRSDWAVGKAVGKE